MKTIEQKAKAYDNLLVRLQEAKVDNDVCDDRYCCVIDEIVPELKENGDDRIRNEIIAFVEQSIHRGGGTPIPQEQEDKWIAWLEKQGEQKSTLPKWKYKNDNTPLLRDSIILNKYGCVAKSPAGALVDDVWVLDYDELKKIPKEEFEKQGEQNPADKVEPKFKVGDWVVYDGWICQIIDVTEDGYCNSQHGFIPKSREDSMRLWTIQDAKEGDVLVCKGNIKNSNGIKYKRICLFNNLGNAFFTLTKISNCVEDYGIDVNIDYPDNTVPATKEQKEILFMAMKDAGYTFDFEKKELKKIKQKSAECGEEDKDMISTIISDLKRHGGDTTYSAEISWLKQFQPKQEWSEEDKVGLANVMWAIKQARTIAKDENDMGNLWYAERWLKSLRPQKQWKPTEEQMKALHDLNLTGAISYAGQGQKLINLYNELKNLREE